MASGDTLAVLTWHNAAFPASSAAGITRRNGHLTIAFDDSTDEVVDFEVVLPQHFSTTLLLFTFVWLAATATSGNVVWQIEQERHEDDADDLDSDNFASTSQGPFTTASVSGEPQYSSLNHAGTGVAGESARFRLRRDADAGGDTMSGDAQLIRMEIKQQ